MHDSGPPPVSSTQVPSPGFSLIRNTPLHVWICLALITAGGLSLRLRNNDFGQPHVYHTDEKRKINAICHMFDQETADPGYFNHPGFLLYTSAGASLIAHHFFDMPLDRMTVLRAARTWVGILGAISIAAAFLLAREVARGLFSSEEDKAGAGASPPSSPAPETESRWKSDTAGLVAAGTLAVLPLHVVSSHYMKEDVPLTLWVILSLLFCVRVARSGRDREYLLATGCCAMAVSTKYAGVVAFACLWVSHWINRKTFPGPKILWAWFRRFGSGWRRVLVVGLVSLSGYLVTAKHAPPQATTAGLIAGVVFLAAVAAFLVERKRMYSTPVSSAKVSMLGWRMIGLGVLVFILLNPYALLNHRGFGRNFDYEARHGTIRGHHGLQVSPWQHGWTFHLRKSLVPGMTLPPLAAALVALLVLWRTREPGSRMLVWGALIWYFAHEASGLKPPPNFDRYMNPLLPLLATGLAGGLVLILSGDVKSRSGLYWLATLTSVLLLAAPLMRSWHLVTQMKPDTRDEALAWCLNPLNIPPGSLVLLNGYGPPVSEAKTQFEWRYASYMHTVSHNEGPLDLEAGTFPLDVDRPEKQSVLRVDFVISSSFRRDRYFDFSATELQGKNRGGRAFYEALEDSWPCEAEFFSPAGPYGYNNPTIRIFRRPGLNGPGRIAVR